MKRLLAALALLPALVPAQPAGAADDAVLEAARRAEAQLAARVGLAIYDTGGARSWLYRAEERFPMASTFKVLACAALLARADAGQETAERPVAIAEGDLVAYSPVTERWVGRAVSPRALCEVTMRTSDNTAANKVLDALGGPPEVTGFLRALGDGTTRLDRRETALNEGAAGDPRDTTSPAAMATSLRELVLGDALSPASRAQLTEWLLANQVGGPLLRAGLPGDWRVGDRTGAGGHGTRGVVAMLWPPQRAPLVAAVYVTQTESSLEQRNAAIAEIGRALAETLAKAP